LRLLVLRLRVGAGGDEYGEDAGENFHAAKCAADLAL
jgi:hypothetical protein